MKPLKLLKPLKLIIARHGVTLENASNIAQGQTDGTLSALGKAAERFDRELGKKIEKLTALAQPAIVFLMAGLVGSMAYLMMTAIFQTIGNISK